MFNNRLTTALFLAGLGQIVLVGASVAIPRILHWREELARLRPLTRQVFTTYAVYIAGTNLSFGLLSALSPASLLAPSVLAVAVDGFITVYWGARVVVQFAYYDRRGGPAGPAARFAEAVLVALFVFLTLVYATAAVTALRALTALPRGA
jgi:hypothetical protein